MGLGDFRIGWRLLLKEPVYSIAVVCGLALGLAVCFLLLAFVRYSFTYNTHIPDSEQIYVVKERRNFLPRPEWRATAPAALLETVLASGLPLQATRSKTSSLALRVDDRVVPLDVRVVETNYLEFFGVRAIDGDAARALARPDALVLNVPTAEKLFGHARVVGKLVHIDGVPFEIMAVLPETPGNSTVAFDALVGGMGKHSWDKAQAGDPPDRAWRAAANVFVKAGPGLDEAKLTALMQDAVTVNRDARTGAGWLKSMKIERLTDIGMVRLSEQYFDESLLRSRAGQAYGNKPAVWGLAGLALLILLLASTNYINLAAVRVVQRQREIGMRKVLGAGRGRLLRQFIAESMVVALLASIAGLLLAWLAMPLFGELVNRPLASMFTPAACAALLLAGAAVGVLSALYPAWLALRLQVRDTLQGRAGTESGHASRLRRAMSVFQFAAAIGLVGMTLVVAWQTQYASHANPGFDPSHLLVINLPERAGAGNEAFRAELARLPSVQGVAGASEAVGRDGNTVVGTVRRTDGVDVAMEIKSVSARFFDVYGLKPLHGRLFAEGRDRAASGNIVLNAMAAAALGFPTPEAAVGRMAGERRIVGIAPDIRYRTLRQAPEPMMYLVDENPPVLTVRTTGPLPQARGEIEALWRRHFPNDVAEIDEAASLFAANYREDARLVRILASASFVATVLAAFGIYVLSAYTVKRRMREIVMRKLHGATGRDIGGLVGREFAILVLAGSAIGIPLAWLAGQRYLAGFVERAPMGAWPLLCALACVALVALAATARHTVAAMRMSPAAALRE
jgi:putative ABC transport system permease protein